MDLLTRLLNERAKFRSPEDEAALLRDLQDLVSLRIQNVADYYFMETDKGNFELHRDFPNVAPPWPWFFMTFKTPPYERRYGQVIRNRNAGTEVGYNFFSSRDEVTGEWQVKCLLLYSSSRQTNRVRILDWRVTKDGEISSIDGSEVKRDRLRIQLSKEADWQGRVLGNDPLPGDLLCIPLLAISFCHCKNVELTQEPVPPKVKAKRERTGGWSPSAWHTLKIEPMRKQLNAAGAGEPNGLKRSLHIMRGHFKDYREGRGLFGKVHGMWWWDFRLAESGHHHQYEVNTLTSVTRPNESAST